ncbi:MULTISPECIES: SDR family oxidoreductase [Halomonadaceae]|uniref:SDR family oxidoreductase n=1 Tax=Halomonadaceae TaxID=28256 RepID=UPI00159953DC|nr:MULTISPECIES: SDR family oxidoreductase [Halomonas]QJQ96293.1 SDR family oxidoreductase [Halomonas sp. PA5]
MALHLKQLDQQIIVITGATSGIGLATARLAARRGAKLVLAARHEGALNQLVDELRKQGAEAVHAVADVGDPDQVHGIAQTAFNHFGGFDTWINNAGVSIFGHLLDVPLEDQRRLFDTNFWGVVHGSLEAARYFSSRTLGPGGAIINLGSVVSDRALPIQGMYSASKHAVQGFTDALRMELEDLGTPVSVTLVKPGSIATPFAKHAQNYMEQEPTLPPPLYEPDIVAKSILHCAEHPRRDIRVGGGSKAIAMLGRYAPRLADLVMERSIIDQQKSGREAQPHEVSLYTPGGDVRERATYSHHVAKRSLYTQASLHPLLTTTLVAGAVLGALALSERGRKLPASHHH